jgi:hypothetical protein
MPEVIVTLDEKDFEQLCRTHMKWCGGNWIEDRKRFEVVRSPLALISFDWEHVYWIGDSWVSVVLVRSYLNTKRADYQIVWDTSIREYAILTDYVEKEVAAQ